MKRFRLPLAAALALALSGAAVSNTNLYIRVNQIGYRAGDTKIAMAFAASPIGPSFSICPAGPASSNSKAVYEGMVTVIEGGTWGKWTQHAELDFSKFKQPGRYMLCVGEASSPVFAIDDKVYEPLPDQLLEFMREQQCGYNPWLGKACHTNDARTAYGSLPYGTELDCTGGWHDAADLLKYLITSANATAQLLLTSELQDVSTDHRAAVGPLVPVRLRALRLGEQRGDRLAARVEAALPAQRRRRGDAELLESAGHVCQTPIVG